MPASEAIFIAVLAVVNLAVGIGLAVVIARRLGEASGARCLRRRHVMWLVGIYFLECIAFAAGMATQVFTIALAIIWGLAFGFWFRARQASCGAVRTVVLLGVYTSMPSVSLGLLLLGAKLLDGADVTSRLEGAALGIPQFVPWPMNTILGFCLVLALGTLAVKLGVTGGLAWFIALRSRENSRDKVGVASGHA